MRYFSAQYIITGTGRILKRGVIATDNDGTIISVTDNEGNLAETAATEFYNGIIIPGLVNCHCHLELSNMKGVIPGGTGLGRFLMNVNEKRNLNLSDQVEAMRNADSTMAREGIVACGDVSNTSASFQIKKSSGIKYITFLEVFGIEKEKAGKRMGDILSLSEKAEEEGLEYSVVPHSLYSLSPELLDMVKESSKSNKVTSVHFMESDDESDFINGGKGPVAESYKKLFGFVPENKGLKSHVRSVLENITGAGNLLLVHCTTTGKDEIQELKKRNSLFYCLCPGSNKYISGMLPPVKLLTEEGCEVVLGTDSLSSNNNLSILGEMKLLQENFPFLKLGQIISWATLNGAKALNQESWAGSIEPGKRPGLVLLSDVELQEMKLLPHTTSRWLI